MYRLFVMINEVPYCQFHKKIQCHSNQHFMYFVLFHIFFHIDILLLTMLINVYFELYASCHKHDMYGINLKNMH